MPMTRRVAAAFPLAPAFPLAVILPLICAATGATAQPAAPLRDVLAPHRAIYDITLARSEDGSGVSSASGRMVFELTGGPCDGYKMRQRMVVNIGDGEGKLGLLDFRITTFESADGATYTFDSRTTVNQDVIDSVAGEARRSGAGIEVKLDQPTKKTVELKGDTLFPSQHMQAIIQSALADRRFVSAEIYDGAGTGEATDAAAATIGQLVSAGADGPLTTGVRHWPVSVGYFDRQDNKAKDFGEETPAYQMRFTLYENGVTNNLVMDYGDYALSGSLQKIEPLAATACRSP